MWAASPCQKSVHKTPGQRAFTVTLYGASSLARIRVKVITPILDTLYGGMVTAAIGPAMEAMLMMRPCRRSMKWGARAFASRKMDLTFTAKTWSQSASVLFVKGIPGREATPALFTRMSSLPKVSSALPTMRSISTCRVTSHSRARARRPSPFTSSATWAALAAWMSGMMMSAPSRAMQWTIPRPIPLPPPVTIATLSASRMRDSSPGTIPRGSINEKRAVVSPQATKRDAARGR